jgi:hypothetical protein
MQSRRRIGIIAVAMAVFAAAFFSLSTPVRADDCTPSPDHCCGDSGEYSLGWCRSCPQGGAQTCAIGGGNAYWTWCGGGCIG